MAAHSDNMDAPHLPVLYKTIITALRPKSTGRYVDGTLGAGGHSAGILAESAPDGEILGLDLDPQALAIAHERLARFGKRAHIVQASYTTMREEAAKLGWGAVDGIVLDFGVSSMQLDTPERGFSFIHDGPLDMRFSPGNSEGAPNAPVPGTGTLSAADLVNSTSEAELADIIFRYGEERLSRKIARAIVNNRPINSTKELADLILKHIGKKERIHPATRTFQALRIAVNGELESIKTVLPLAVDQLKPGGRLAVISFHSLEDRLVKEYFRRESTDCICPPRQPICTCGHKASIIEINRKPIEASEEEILANSRSRSAKLRVAEKK
jgi:16S rRNA (cytosine1402-N4)-methyltransferase